MTPSLRIAFEHELSSARGARRAGALDRAMHHLERAHVLGQAWVGPHVRSPHVDHGEGRIDDGDSHFATICQRDLLPWHAGGQERSAQRSIWFQVLKRNTRPWAWHPINEVIALDLGLPLAHRHMRDVAFARIRSQHVYAGHRLNGRYQALIDGKRSHCR